MAKMGSLVVSLELQQEQFQKGMDAAAKQLARAEAQSKKTQTALTGLQTGMKGFAEVGNALKAAFAGISLTALVNQVGALVDQVGAIGEQADSVALTTDAFQAFSAALRDAGVNADATAALLGKAARTVGDALEGGKQQIEFFQKLNVGLLDAQGNAAPMADVMQRTAAAILAVEDPARRVALASEFMGKSGRDAIPALEQLAQGAAALSAEFAKEIIPAEVIARFDAFGDKVGQLKAQVRKDAAIAINDFFSPALMTELDRLLSNFGALAKDLVTAFNESGGASDTLTEALRNTNRELEDLAKWWNSATSSGEVIKSALRAVTLETMNLNQALADGIAFLRGLFSADNASEFAAHAQHIRDQIQIMRDAAAELASLGGAGAAAPGGTVIDIRGGTKPKPTGFPTPKGGGGGGKSEAEKEAEALKKRGEALAAAVDEQEAYNQKLREYDELLGKGAITQDIFEKAVAKAREQLTAQADALRATVDPAFAFWQQVDKINQALRDGQIAYEIYIKLMEKAREEFDKQQGGKKKSPVEELTEDVTRAIGAGVGEFFSDIITGSKSAADAFAKMVEKIISDLAKLLAEFAAKAAAKFIIKSLFGDAAPAAAGNAVVPSSLMLASRPPTFNAAASLAPSPFAAPRAANGNEAVGGAASGASPWHVTVNNNAPGVDVTTSTRSDGGLDVQIDKVRSILAQDVMRGGNSFSRSLESAYSLGRGR